MRNKVVKIKIPKGHKIDIENSALECVQFEPLKAVKTWNDLKGIEGYYPCLDGRISKGESNKFLGHLVASSEKVAKMMVASAKISQLMPYYGGTVEHGEPAFIISPQEGVASMDTIYLNRHTSLGGLLRFKSEEIAKRFIENNNQLVRDYLMYE